MSSDFRGDTPDDEDAALAVLLALHRRNQERARRRTPADSYARILSHFERRAQRLRGERLVTSELIERLFAGGRAVASPRLQQELEIQGRAGERAAGRFRIVNRSQAEEPFELIAGEPTQAGPPMAVSFDPPRGTLAAGQGLLVRVEASLAGWRPGDSTTVPVEIRWPAGRDRLWLAASALPAVGEDGR